MRLSEAQSSYLAHQILTALKTAGATVRTDRIALSEIKKHLARDLDQDQAIHERVVKRIHSLQRPVPEGSAEYDVLYRQYSEQERGKRRR